MSEPRELRLAANLDSLAQVREFVLASARIAGIDEVRSGELLLAVDEAVTNIVMHGCPDGSCGIELTFIPRPGACVIRIRDDAPAFDPLAYRAPESAIPLLQRETIGGFGITLLRRMADEVSYRRTADGHNELTLVKRSQ